MTGSDPAILPFDLYAAAEFFLETGRTLAEVLERLQVTEADWRKLAPVYFDQLHSSDYLWRFDSLYPGVSGSALLSALAGPRQQPPAADVAMWKWTRGIRAAILENPHVGCFSDVAWIATFLMFDPVATLRYYSTDGRSVFQCGEAIADKAGVPLQVDAAAFRHVGGRYYTDGVHVFGQGELGGTRVRRYFWIVERADPASFTALNLYYARDNERAWYITGKEIRTRSSRSFEIVPWLRLNYRDESRDLSSHDSRFARDGEHVYFYGARLKAAKPATFRDLGHDYATDGTTVWFLGTKKPVAGADASSFIVPGPGEPYVRGSSGAAAVTDRFRCYDRGVAVDPVDHFELWRPFFEFRTDLTGWWWHDQHLLRS